MLAAASTLSCANRETLAFSVVSEGIINDPSNKSLRFDLLKFGLEQFCLEMTSRGAPLKLADDMPVAGRFYAASCQHQILDDAERKSLVVQYTGRGFGWTNLSGRIGFTSQGLAEYAPDFQVHEGVMYIYFRPQSIKASSFQTLMVESQPLTSALASAGIDANQIGTDLVKGELERGFTVLRYNDRGETDFSLGMVELGTRPQKPFEVESTDRVTLANDRTEVHSGQQDFVGSFEVTEDDDGLHLTAMLDGAPSADLVVLPQASGAQLIGQYVQSPGAVRLNGSPVLQETISQGKLWQRSLELPQGEYLLLIDHSSAVGQAVPPASPADSPAHVSYVVQRGPID